MLDFAVIPSVCGDVMVTIDQDETELDIVCCDNCRSILICRKAWDFLYKKGGK